MSIQVQSSLQRASSRTPARLAAGSHGCIPCRPCRSTAVRVRAAAQAAPDATKPAAAAQQLKQDIIRMSGSKYGHDLDAATREAVQAKVKQLEALQLPVKVEQGALTGSKWTTVFTTSDGTSSGKVGPFITDVVQEFPAAEPGVYYNVSSLGLVSARLRGEYAVTRDDRVDLEFKNLVLKVGPFQAAEKVFEAGQMRGYWRMSYVDGDFRVFYTNKDNMFILRKL
ncbi:hypothetical protein OEZ85_002185 [Tetradesmus obliquus]|uniref:Plastid lipid-associated protein/fibrillin conserved domain-containing protein n=1 Tax=Tetradesmus obliquus TaxID=3088 RepID=A0ABY8U274_TETOB|nr:hypothetical protein OEZ85_002185 [Tetradesmus obliquus]